MISFGCLYLGVSFSVDFCVAELQSYEKMTELHLVVKRISMKDSERREVKMKQGLREQNKRCKHKCLLVGRVNYKPVHEKDS